MVYLTCADIGLGGRGVINTWTDVAARVRLYMLTSDLTSLVPPQFSNWLQVRKVGTAYFFNFLFTIGAAQVTEIRTKITDRMCEQKPCTTWFSCRRKDIWFNVSIPLPNCSRASTVSLHHNKTCYLFKFLEIIFLTSYYHLHQLFRMKEFLSCLE